MSTTTTTLTELIYAEWITPMILSYAHDFTVALPFFQQHDLRGKSSGTVSVPQWVSDVGAHQEPAETTALTAEALETVDVTITTAEMGILREVTKNAQEDVLMSGAELFQYIVQDGGRILGIAIEDDAVALFTALTTVVGVSGADLTLADMVAAISGLRKNGVRAFGGAKFILDDQQSEDFDTAGLASVSTTINSYFQRAEGNGLDNGFVGNFAGYDVWQTGLCDTVNAGADVAGALMVDGSMQSNQGFAPFGFAISRLVEVDTDKDIEARTQKVSMDARWGVGTQFDLAAVGIQTDA